MRQTSLMGVEFKYENEAVPTASLAGTEAFDVAALPRDCSYRAIIASAPPTEIRSVASPALMGPSEGRYLNTRGVLCFFFAKSITGQFRLGDKICEQTENGEIERVNRVLQFGC